MAGEWHGSPSLQASSDQTLSVMLPETATRKMESIQ